MRSETLTTGVVLCAFLLAIGLAQPPTAHAQAVNRFAANYSSSEELFTNSNPASGGLKIYDNTVSVPADINTLFVTITGAGDNNGSTQLLLNCTVDGTPCVSTNFATNASPADWVALLIDPSGTDSEDHSFSYTWCTPVHKGTGSGKLHHDITLSIASSISGVFINIERVIVTIDGAKIKDSANACGTF